MNLRQKFSLQNQISLSNSGKVDRRWIVPGDVPASRPIKNSTLDRHRIPTLGPDSVSRRAILILGLGLILSISIVFFTKNQHKEDVTNVAEFNTLERDDGYRASIEKEANIVTITLREPKALIHTDNKNSTHKNVSVSNKNNSPESISQIKENPRLVTHTVVKGDTLWYITKKYVKNPYLYPELARLSNITNPDLIYPGDLVRIKFF